MSERKSFKYNPNFVFFEPYKCVAGRNTYTEEIATFQIDNEKLALKV